MVNSGERADKSCRRYCRQLASGMRFTKDMSILAGQVHISVMQFDVSGSIHPVLCAARPRLAY
jgi:hypothetical protein